jgi:hypothetical protein
MLVQIDVLVTRVNYIRANCMLRLELSNAQQPVGRTFIQNSIQIGLGHSGGSWATSFTSCMLIGALQQMMKDGKVSLWRSKCLSETSFAERWRARDDGEGYRRKAQHGNLPKSASEVGPSALSAFSI